MRYVLDIKKPNDDVGFAKKDFPELDHVPVIGSTIFPEVVGKLNDLVYTTVVEVHYVLTDSYVLIMCELTSEEDVAGFTTEKGWELNNFA